jgi:hypothetical protein
MVFCNFQEEITHLFLECGYIPCQCQLAVAKSLKNNSIHIKKLKDTHIITNEEKMKTRISVCLTTLYITYTLL